MTRPLAPVARFAVGVVAVALAATGAGACADDGGPAAGGSPSSTAAPTSSTAGSPVTTAPRTTGAATATSNSLPGASTTTARSTTTTAPPPVVTDVRAGPGGGSGEVSVVWRGVTGAVRYRVERAPAATGPFDVAGVLDVATGSATRAPGVTNVYAAGDGSFVLVEVVTDLTNGGLGRWYRVVAEGAGGAAAPSRVVCGAPPGAPAC